MEYKEYSTYISFSDDSPALHAGYVQHKAVAAYVDSVLQSEIHCDVNLQEPLQGIDLQSPLKGMQDPLKGGDFCTPLAILLVRIVLGIAAVAILYTKIYGVKLEIPLLNRATSVWILQKISKQLKIPALVDRIDYYEALIQNMYESVVQFFSTYSVDSLLNLFEAKNGFVGAGLLDVARKTLKIAMTATDFYEAAFEIVETSSGFKNLTNILCLPVTVALHVGSTVVNVAGYVSTYVSRR